MPNCDYSRRQEYEKKVSFDRESSSRVAQSPGEADDSCSRFDDGGLGRSRIDPLQFDGSDTLNRLFSCSSSRSLEGEMVRRRDIEAADNVTKIFLVRFLLESFNCSKRCLTDS